MTTCPFSAIHMHKYLEVTIWDWVVYQWGASLRASELVLFPQQTLAIALLLMVGPCEF